MLRFILTWLTIIGVPVILGMYIVHILGKKFSNHSANMNLLVKILQTKLHSNLFYNYYVQGIYKGRYIACGICFTFIDTDMGHVFGTSNFKNKNYPIILCVDSQPSKEEGWARLWTRPKEIRREDLIRPVTDKTHLHRDGKIYYTYLPISKDINDKKFLSSILNTKLAKEDLEFFLEELIRAADCNTSIRK